MTSFSDSLNCEPSTQTTLTALLLSSTPSCTCSFNSALSNWDASIVSFNFMVPTSAISSFGLPENNTSLFITVIINFIYMPNIITAYFADLSLSPSFRPSFAPSSMPSLIPSHAPSMGSSVLLSLVPSAIPLWVPSSTPLTDPSSDLRTLPLSLQCCGTILTSPLPYKESAMVRYTVTHWVDPWSLWLCTKIQRAWVICHFIYASVNASCTESNWIIFSSRFWQWASTFYTSHTDLSTRLITYIPTALMVPNIKPTNMPIELPSVAPSSAPSFDPLFHRPIYPSNLPSMIPTSNPGRSPTNILLMKPSDIPSFHILYSLTDQLLAALHQDVPTLHLYTVKNTEISDFSAADDNKIVNSTLSDLLDTTGPDKDPHFLFYSFLQTFITTKYNGYLPLYTFLSVGKRGAGNCDPTSCNNNTYPTILSKTSFEAPRSSKAHKRITLDTDLLTGDIFKEFPLVSLASANPFEVLSGDEEYLNDSYTSESKYPAQETSLIENSYQNFLKHSNRYRQSTEISFISLNNGNENTQAQNENKNKNICDNDEKKTKNKNKNNKKTKENKYYSSNSDTTTSSLKLPGSTYSSESIRRDIVTRRFNIHSEHLKSHETETLTSAEGRAKGLLEFIQTYKFEIPSIILEKFDEHMKNNHTYCNFFDKTLCQLLYAHIYPSTLNSLHHFHRSGVNIFTALQRKYVTTNENNKVYLKNILKYCKMHKNATATGFLLKLQNLSYKSKQTDDIIKEAMLPHHLKKCFIYNLKVESLGIRAYLKNNRILIYNLEQPFFSSHDLQAREKYQYKTQNNFKGIKSNKAQRYYTIQSRDLKTKKNIGFTRQH